jgi:hypothetical protein
LESQRRISDGCHGAPVARGARSFIQRASAESPPEPLAARANRSVIAGP